MSEQAAENTPRPPMTVEGIAVWDAATGEGAPVVKVTPEGITAEGFTPLDAGATEDGTLRLAPGSMTISTEDW